MSTFNGLPAHILLNHFVVVLGPLTAILAIVCAVWPAARRRLIWLVLLLAVATLALTPVTANAGGWLAARVATTSPALTTHEQLGGTLIYMVAALVATVTLLAAVHIRQARGRTVKLALQSVVGLLVIAAAVATLVQTYRIGDSGARAAWGNVTSSAQ
jgi:glucan phosphoethanolaminetransferase (alkaline phosphatase superfamily)